METFFKVFAALLTAVAVILVTLKLIDAVNRDDDEKKRTAKQLRERLKKSGNKIKEAASGAVDEIADFRFEPDDDLFGDIDDAFSDLADDAEDIFEDVTDAISDAADDVQEELSDAVDEIAEAAEDISEDALDKLLGGDGE